MRIREACLSDANGISEVLQELIAAGKRSNRGDLEFVRSHYLEHPHRLHCFVALDEQNRVVGFQSLKVADDTNPYETPTGWGIIGTHIRPSAGRTGVGSRLFEATLAAARAANLPAVEAYIGEENEPALAYYEALGFRTYRRSAGAVCKSLEISRSSAA